MSNENKDYIWSFSEIRKLDKRLNDFDDRLNAIERRLDAIDQKLDRLSEKVDDTIRRFKNKDVVLPPAKDIDWKTVGIAIAAFVATVYTMVKG